jgi:hypothetical protein
MRADRKRSSTFGSLFWLLLGLTERYLQKTITCTLTNNQLRYAWRDGMLLSALRQPVQLCVTLDRPPSTNQEKSTLTIYDIKRSHN